MTPIWIVNDQAVPLNPPAEILKLGEMPRTPEKILAATRALCVTTAKRYQPDDNHTWCNVNTSDYCQIIRAPLPHVFDLQDGQGRRELRANDIVDGLRALKFQGWSKLGTLASAEAVVAWVAQGKPAVATWKNLTPKKDSAGRVLTVNGRIQYRSGHINPVVPTPAGKSGVHVTGAGAHCVQECPIEFSFGQYVREVEFWGHE
jgi:hypothetical protein